MPAGNILIGVGRTEPRNVDVRFAGFSGGLNPTPPSCVTPPVPADARLPWRLRHEIFDLCHQQEAPADVVILSRYRLEQSAAADLTNTTGFCIRPADASVAVSVRKPTFLFATAQAFKGMESKIVVLCDVDRIETEEDRSLLYVAMSRARSLLTVLLHTRTKAAVREAFLRKMSEQWR
jgi:hypothetical protein